MGGAEDAAMLSLQASPPPTPGPLGPLPGLQAQQVQKGSTQSWAKGWHSRNAPEKEKPGSGAEPWKHPHFWGTKGKQNQQTEVRAGDEKQEKRSR